MDLFRGDSTQLRNLIRDQWVILVCRNRLSVHPLRPPRRIGLPTGRVPVAHKYYRARIQFVSSRRSRRQHPDQRALEGVNAGYIAEMQERWLADPASVDPGGAPSSSPPLPRQPTACPRRHPRPDVGLRRSQQPAQLPEEHPAPRPRRVARAQHDRLAGRAHGDELSRHRGGRARGTAPGTRWPARPRRSTSPPDRLPSRGPRASSRG